LRFIEEYLNVSGVNAVLCEWLQVATCNIAVYTFMCVCVCVCMCAYDTEKLSREQRQMIYPQMTE